MKSGIYGLQGSACWLSNFAPVDIAYDGVIYPSVEHFYVTMKIQDKDERVGISKIVHPGRAKKYGQLITKEDRLRPDWENIRLLVMEYGLRKKFSKLPYSCNWKDTFWRVCDGVGENNLGKLLMKIRNDNS